MGIKGFTPTEPFNFTHGNIAQSDVTDTTHFPSLAELNADLFDWHPGKEEALAADVALCIELDVVATDLTAQPHRNSAPALVLPRVPDMSNLTSQLFLSDDKLFLSLTKSRDQLLPNGTWPK